MSSGGTTVCAWSTRRYAAVAAPQFVWIEAEHPATIDVPHVASLAPTNEGERDVGASTMAILAAAWAAPARFCLRDDVVLSRPRA